MNIKLTLVNQSQDTNNSQIVIFQKNVADVVSTPIAWKVIENCTPGSSHAFTVDTSTTIATSDEHGNATPPSTAAEGQVYQVMRATSGNALELGATSSESQEVQVRNTLPNGAINASIYKSGKLLATASGIAPQQHAKFQFEPKIWIGVARQVVEGGVMSAQAAAGIDTELSLDGVASAEIVMTGGGPDDVAEPFVFVLRNVKVL